MKDMGLVLLCDDGCVYDKRLLFLFSGEERREEGEAHRQKCSKSPLAQFSACFVWYRQ